MHCKDNASFENDCLCTVHIFIEVVYIETGTGVAGNSSNSLYHI